MSKWLALLEYLRGHTSIVIMCTTSNNAGNVTYNIAKIMLARRFVTQKEVFKID